MKDERTSDDKMEAIDMNVLGRAARTSQLEKIRNNTVKEHKNKINNSCMHRTETMYMVRENSWNERRETVKES